MPRNLADVLHHFLPEVDAPGPAPAAGPVAPTQRVARICVPVEAGDVTRSALVWNLAVEIARRAGGARLVTPTVYPRHAAWPHPGPAAHGVRLQAIEASSPGEFGAQLVPPTRAEAAAPPRELSILCVPATWLQAAEAKAWLDWILVLLRPGAEERATAYAALEPVVRNLPATPLGVTVHGVRSVEEARETFTRLACMVEQRLERTLTSYGLLVDDLDLCRSIVSRRPLAVTHPAAPAARALRDVARLLLADAGESELG